MATQDERWMARYRECLRFLEEEGRKPSKHYPEERNLRSWWKHNKKLLKRMHNRHIHKLF